MIFVDQAVWPWRNQHWAHLISDTGQGELHDFAENIGKRRSGFQGDHYDVTAAERERALLAGAQSIQARELVKKLRASGLRRRNAFPKWSVRSTQTAAPTELPALMLAKLANSAVAARLISAARQLFEPADTKTGRTHLAVHPNPGLWRHCAQLEVILLERLGEAALMLSRPALSEFDRAAHQPLGSASPQIGSQLGISEIRKPLLPEVKHALCLDLLVLNASL